jgi:hypothetical protein
MKNIGINKPNYGKTPLLVKIKNRLRNEIANRISNTWFQFRFYISYWNFKCRKSVQKGNENLHFLTQFPDSGAGIGHQLANWNSGFYFAHKFGVNFAHSEFSSSRWDSFLGFGENEVKAKDLLGVRGFRKVRLPRFDSENEEQIELVKNIINSYNGHLVLFLMEINQGYLNQFETHTLLSNKFFNASSRKGDNLKFEIDTLSIAIHIRRRMLVETDEMFRNRGLENSYFKEVLQKVLVVIGNSKNYKIYLFSQGDIDEFPEFKGIENLEFCLDMNPYDSFSHMCKANLLISSKSSFSYKPALISKGIKICPNSFWHNYPKSPDYIMADDLGNFDINHLSNQLNLIN